MEQEINKIIAEHLPEQVGKVLKLRLEQAESDRRDLANVQAALINANDLVQRRDKEVADLQAKIKHQLYVEDLLQTIKERERGLEIEILNIRLEEAEKRNSIGERLVEQVFRSPVYRKYTESRDHGSYDAQGRYSVTHSTPVNETTSID